MEAFTMSFKQIKIKALLLLLAIFSTQESQAVTYNLRAALGTKTMADGTSVPVWGFADDTTLGAGNGVVTVPGPQLTAVPGDTLTINLTNNLSVPISIIIPGQRLSPAPTYANDPRDNKSHVVSFANQVAPGTTVNNITFPGLKAGTFLYESGTNPALQVSMGLYGALVVVGPGGSGPAYPPNISTTYNRDEVLLFSDILARFDKGLNNYVTLNKDVIDNTYVTTLDYNPLYYLINGKSFPDTIAPVIPAPAGVPANLPGIYAPQGQKTLLRLINASAHNYMPTVSGTYFDNAVPAQPHSFSAQVIAEDGNLYRYPKPAVAMVLPAGKTLDAMLDLTVAASQGYYALYDRRLGLTNAGTYPGGMLTFLASWGATENCSPFKGDVNGDGRIDFIDVMAVLRLVMAGGFNANGDVFPVSVSGLPCGNGTLDLSDALLLLQKAAGFSSY
jgi:FtsP/CotA-like multicopper oxidase with cupredoxin domain